MMLPSCRLIVKGQKRGKEDSPAHEVQTKFAAASVPDKSFIKDFFLNLRSWTQLLL